MAVGEILGLFVNGVVSERFGYRKTVLWSLFFVTAFVSILFFAPSVEVLFVDEILCGILWGVFQTLTTVYAAEVCPVSLRAYLTTYVNLIWVFGTLLGQGILRAFVEGGSSEWAYRIPFAIQNLSGSGFMGYSTYFFQQAGLDTKESFNISMG